MDGWCSGGQAGAAQRPLFSFKVQQFNSSTGLARKVILLCDLCVSL
jgi:hypothetical protein